ncbi:VIT1/CCC1 transporter family protein [Nostocoides vanveenii]|uniref:VIT family protein n=1 Tax=Nostocoides vanveenii TaxID=330835 RepID=A0ABN2KND8_9MICO
MSEADPTLLAAAAAETGGAHHEPHDAGAMGRLNWLRAGVLGANDGIVSTAGLVIGVAAATNNRAAIFTAGLAGLAAGAMSMAVGEYVSVSTQRDSERAMVAKERLELAQLPHTELLELAEIYEGKGLPPRLALDVAKALTEHDALAAHAEAELRIDPDDLTNPWHAAIASMISFTMGALLPLLAILNPATGWRIPGTVVVVLVALALTGYISARLGGAAIGRAVLRVVLGGILAMAVTYGIGRLFGTAVS